jgi:aminoglycoside 6'-N-acetyltransferase I
MMPIDFKILGRRDEDVLTRVAAGVFDRGIDPARAAEFLADARHHLAVAIEADVVIGFASAVHYVHPDKPPQMWINEVGVSPAHRGQGVGKRLLAALFERARELHCREAWVLTEQDNAAARRLYASAGGHPEQDQVMFTFKLA